MIKNYDNWLNESNDEFYLPADQWGFIDEQLLDYFDVELDDLVCLGTPGIGWSSDSQPELYKLVRSMYIDGEITLDDNADDKDGVSEGGKKVYYVFFDKPFKVVVASIKGSIKHINPLGQIYILKSTAEDLIHQFRGKMHSPKYGI